MSRLCTALVLISISILATACSSEEPPARTSAPPAPTRRPGESPQELKLSNLGEQFERIKTYSQDNPRQLDRILSQISNFKSDAAGTKFEKESEKLASDARTRFKDDARATYQKLRDQAEKLIAEGKAREALEVLGEYPAEFCPTEWQEKIDQMTEPIEKEAHADSRLDTLQGNVKAQLEEHNPEAALELVNGYPESMRTGRRKEKWEKLHSELSAKVAAIREQKRREEAVPWEDLFTGADMDKWSPQAGEWEIRDLCIVGKYSGGSVGFIYCGREDSPWDNFILELEFKIVSGDFLVLGVRGKNEGGHSVFDQIDLRSDDFPPGKFHLVTVDARDNIFTIRANGTGKVHTQEAEQGYTRGPICFFIPSGAEVHIRKARIKTLK